MHKAQIVLGILVSTFLFSFLAAPAKAANPLELNLFTNENNPNLNEKTKIYLLAKTNSDLQVNGILTGIRVPKNFNVNNLNLEIPTSFIFNHIEATDHVTYTQIEIMLAKKTGTFFTLKNNDPIVSFDVESSTAGSFIIDPVSTITTSVLDLNQAELFEKYNPSALTINVIDNTPSPIPTAIPTPSPTPLPTIIPSPTPMIPTPSPIPTIVVPTPIPTVIIPTPSPTPTPYIPVTFGIPTKIEAEYFNKNESDNNFAIVDTITASNGSRIGYIKKDSYAIYNVSNSLTRKFDITFSYSSFDNTVPNKSLSLYKINSTGEEFIGLVDIDNTNGWDIYKQQALKEVLIDSDTKKLKVVFNTDYFDLDYFDIQESTIPSPTPTIITPTPTPVIPSPTPTSIPSPTIIPTPIVPSPTPTPTTPTPTTVVPSISPTPEPSLEPTPITFQISNLKVKSDERYIHAIKGLFEKNRIYSDRWYKFRYIPQALKGLDFIRTANDDKRSTGNDFLSFGINKKSEIYVAHDIRIKNKPEWLKSFTNTGLTIKGDFGMNFTIYKKIYEIGEVVLGGNQESKFRRYDVSNYFIIIKPIN